MTIYLGNQPFSGAVLTKTISIGGSLYILSYINNYLAK